MDEGHVRPVFNQEALFFVRMLYIFTFQEPLAICFVLSLSRSFVGDETVAWWRNLGVCAKNPKVVQGQVSLWLTGWLTLSPT
jgi:hypothetical protein